MKTGILGGARRGVIYFLFIFFILEPLIFLGKRRDIAGGLVHVT